MKLDTDKCHLLVSGTKYEHSQAKIGDDKIWESNEFKFLGVKIDNKLKFNSDIANIWFKANKKLSVLRRLAGMLYLDLYMMITKPYVLGLNPSGWFIYCSSYKYSNALT